MENPIVIDSDIYERSLVNIAQGALTNSKSPDCLIRGAYPTHIEKAQGALLYDTKGNEYIDYICGLGTNLFGYANLDIIRAIHDEIYKGLSYSLCSKIEVEAAEKFKELFHWVDMVKFLKTGSEACNAAIRMARAYTGRHFVLSEGYHGWGDEFTSLTPPATGVNSQPFICKLTSLEQINNSIAAVIVEPVQLDDSITRLRYLNNLKEKCKETGTVLIFDEVITGVRYKNYSVSNSFDIYPDLLIMGKAMAGGLPLAVVAGKKDIMNFPGYFVSSTYAGENASLRAFIKIFELLWNKKFDLKELWSYGQDFIDKFNSLWPNKIWIEGYAVRGSFNGDQDIIHMFWQEAAQTGMIFGPSWFYNFAHIEYQYRVLSFCHDIINNIKAGNVKLWGARPQSPFSSRSRE